MKPKKFVAALVALSLVSCLVPARAFAYVDYSGDQALTQVSAVYQFLREYGGASDLPEVNDTSAAQFYANILGQTATPFYSFLYNYSYYAIFAGWRVYQSSDFEDADARARYQASMDAAVEYLQHEWAAWVEEYPGAGGGGGGGGSSEPTYGPVSGLPSGIGIIFASTLTLNEEMTFADGHTIYLASSSAVNSFNAASLAGSSVCLFSTDNGYTFYGSVRSISGASGSYSPASGHSGFSFASPAIASLLGVSSPSGASVLQGCPISAASSNFYSLGYGAPEFVMSRSISESPAQVGVAGPSDYYWPVMSSPTFSRLYIVSNAPIYLYGTWYGGSPSSAPEGPTGPTAPDYEVPEPYEPVNPTLPNITNNITNNPSSYTGSETDYSDFLKIIIDNQKEQIQQIRDLGTLIDNEWDGFTNWLNSELDDISGYLYNYQQFWNTLLQYQKSGNGYLYSIDQQILMLRNRLSNDANMLWGLLRDIYYKIPSDNSGTLPDITIDDGNGGGFLNWLYDLIDQAVDLLVGGSAELTGMLDDLRQLTGVFPFSLPWDLIAVLTVLQHEPVSDLTLQYPIIDGVAEGGGVSWTWHELDLTFAQPLIVACNFGFFGLALLGLIHATKDMFEMVNKVVG